MLSVFVIFQPLIQPHLDVFVILSAVQNRINGKNRLCLLYTSTDIVFDYDMRRGEVLHTNRSVAVYGLPQIVAGAPQAIVDSGAVPGSYTQLAAAYSGPKKR